MLKDFFTFWIPVLLVPYYLYSTYTKLYELANPLTGLDIEDLKHSGLVSPLWNAGEKFKLLAFLSHKEKFSPYSISSLRDENLLLIEKDDLEFKFSDHEIKLNLNIVRSNDVSSGIYIVKS